MFDNNIIKSTKFNLPVICIGNITVGGTGKTPHTEYLVNLLKNNYKLATLSRGYKRKSKGFVLANNSISADQIGDEPMQIYRKNRDIDVAVDANRVNGVNQILKQKPDTELILLDDAYKHRYIKPSFSILLTDYNRPIYNDQIMPMGRLREGVGGKCRASIVIVSKTPKTITPIDRRIIIKKLKLQPWQKLFFTTVTYDNIINLANSKSTNNECLKDKDILLVTGIANPKPLKKYVEQYSKKVKLKAFPDHHNFKKSDIKDIVREFNDIKDTNKIIITTEKDAVRLMNLDLPKNIKNKIYYIPIKIEFLFNRKDDFDKLVYNLIREETKKITGDQELRIIKKKPYVL